jgi:hypothetical protein
VKRICVLYNDDDAMNGDAPGASANCLKACKFWEAAGGFEKKVKEDQGKLS